MITNDPFAGTLKPMEFPPRLMKIAEGMNLLHLDFKGNPDLLMKPGIGFCGSRHASEASIAAVRDCAGQVVEKGYAVVSGNAAGIDAEAHTVALEMGGDTILVLPFGIRHFKIRRELKSVWDWQKALVISQFPENAGWAAWRAMERNNVIVALSHALIVMEAGEKGGTMAAGASALKSCVPLFVIDYTDNPHAVGNTTLIKQGGERILKRRSNGYANLERMFSVVSNGEAAKFGSAPRWQGQSLFASSEVR